MVRPA